MTSQTTTQTLKDMTPKEKAQEALRLLKEAVVEAVESGGCDRNSTIAVCLGLKTDRSMLTWEVLRMLTESGALSKEAAK